MSVPTLMSASPADAVSELAAQRAALTASLTASPDVDFDVRVAGWTAGGRRRADKLCRQRAALAALIRNAGDADGPVPPLLSTLVSRWVWPSTLSGCEARIALVRRGLRAAHLWRGHDACLSVELAG